MSTGTAMKVLLLWLMSAVYLLALAEGNTGSSLPVRSSVSKRSVVSQMSHQEDSLLGRDLTGYNDLDGANMYKKRDRREGGRSSANINSIVENIAEAESDNPSVMAQGMDQRNSRTLDDEVKRDVSEKWLHFVKKETTRGDKTAKDRLDNKARLLVAGRKRNGGRREC